MIMMFLMKLFSARKFQKGFTLIELLVVIGILGILAAALVATIDPFEQLKKADDSKIKNIAVEFQTANVRYYTTHGAFPWNDSNNGDATCTGLEATAPFTAQLDSAEMVSCITNALIAEGELKNSFAINTNDLARVYVTWDDTDATNMVVCFEPHSKSQKAAPDSQYDNDGGAYSGAQNCPSANADDGECHWCTR